MGRISNGEVEWVQEDGSNEHLFIKPNYFVQGVDGKTTRSTLLGHKAFAKGNGIFDELTDIIFAHKDGIANLPSIGNPSELERMTVKTRLVKIVRNLGLSKPYLQECEEIRDKYGGRSNVYLLSKPQRELLLSEGIKEKKTDFDSNDEGPSTVNIRNISRGEKGPILEVSERWGFSYGTSKGWKIDEKATQDFVNSVIEKRLEIWGAKGEVVDKGFNQFNQMEREYDINFKDGSTIQLSIIGDTIYRNI